MANRSTHGEGLEHLNPSDVWRNDAIWCNVRYAIRSFRSDFSRYRTANL